MTPNEKKQLKEISVEDLRDFMDSHRIVFDQTDTKQFSFVLSGVIEIRTKKENEGWPESMLYGSYFNPFTALRYYNELT